MRKCQIHDKAVSAVRAIAVEVSQIISDVIAVTDLGCFLTTVAGHFHGHFRERPRILRTERDSTYRANGSLFLGCPFCCAISMFLFMVRGPMCRPPLNIYTY